MEFLQNIVAVLRFEPASFSIPFFVFSVCMLVLGLTLKTYSHAFKLKFLEHTPLNKIEKNHPHLPSPRTITVIVLCCATLLMAALQSVQGNFPFTDPYQGLNLASLFIILAAIGIMAELKWRGTREYASAFLAGTALAFLVLIIQSRTPVESGGHKLLTIALLVPSLLVVGYTLSKEHRRGALFTLLLAFAFWVLIFFLQ